MGKGFMFTLLVVLLFLFIMLSIRAFVSIQQSKEESTTIRVRVGTLKDFLGSVETDGSRITFISGYRALFYSAFYVANNLTYLDDSEDAIQELMWNATLDGEETYGVPEGTCEEGSTTCNFTEQMKNATIPNWVGRMQHIASFYGMDMYWADGNFSINQPTPWTVAIYHDDEVRIEDVNGIAAYDKWISFNRSIPLEDFEDPTHSYNSDGVAHRFVRKWPYPDDINFFRPRIGGEASLGYSWIYSNVTVIPWCCSIDNCTDGTLDSLDNSTILVVGNIDPVSTSCPEKANAFAGIISDVFADVSSLTVPYAVNFSDPLKPTDVLSTGDYILLNGDYYEVLNITKLLEMLFSGYYREATNAPSYLMRLEGNMSSSPMGIESFVGDWATANRSWIDWVYFNGTECGTINCYRVKGTPNCEDPVICADDSIPHFRVDDLPVFQGSPEPTHIEYYYLQNLTVPN